MKCRSYSRMKCALAGIVDRIIQQFATTLHACSVAARQRALNQLWVIQRRAVQKHISQDYPASAKFWSSGYRLCAGPLKGRGFADKCRADDKLYCAIRGCETLEPSGTACGRCNTPYCSEKCQKRYVLFEFLEHDSTLSLKRGLALKGLEDA